MLRKVLRTIGDIKGSGVAHSNFEARESGEDDLQVAVADYINMRGTTQVPNILYKTACTKTVAAKDEDAIHQ